MDEPVTHEFVLKPDKGLVHNEDTGIEVGRRRTRGNTRDSRGSIVNRVEERVLHSRISASKFGTEISVTNTISEADLEVEVGEGDGLVYETQFLKEKKWVGPGFNLMDKLDGPELDNSGSVGGRAGGRDEGTIT